MSGKEKQMQSVIDMMKKWITAALSSSNYKADFSLESLKDIDRFFDEQNTDDGILSKNAKGIIFALGIYVGETIIANYGGEWIDDEYKDPNTIKLKTKDGELWFPVIRVMSRYQYGSANSLYSYGQLMGKKKETDKKFETKSIDDIWKMENRNDFVINMYLYIAEKCKYGDAMQNLNDAQRVFYITQNLEMEVNNGGFSQFFCNTDGIFVNELVESFKKIGAIKTAEICEKSVGIFGDTLLTDIDKIQSILNTDDEEMEEKNSKILNECDMAFYEYEEDLEELNYQFIIKNRESFLI